MLINFKMKGNVIPVIGRGGPYGCETLRFTYILDNGLRFIFR
jgi:hypothetical protein